MEASADGRIKVRKITDLHGNYSITGNQEQGQFSLQLILDDGAEEHLVLPDAEGTKVLLRLLRESDSAYFDTEKRIVTLGRLGD